MDRILFEHKILVEISDMERGANFLGNLETEYKVLVCASSAAVPPAPAVQRMRKPSPQHATSKRLHFFPSYLVVSRKKSVCYPMYDLLREVLMVFCIKILHPNGNS